ncbi:MAG: hypothetical protein Q4B57_08290 [Eubacteriales bacterium]|nr:hypothetical protein [Eubacteriales bacterium]
MSEYRHFVAYIYEYRDGKKAENAGHIRVDARDGVCRLRLQMQADRRAGGFARIYGFARRGDWLPCIAIGECTAPGGAYRLTVTTPVERFAGSDFQFREICGIYARTDQGKSYVSVWDDIPVEITSFVIHNGEEQEAQEHSLTETTKAENAQNEEVQKMETERKEETEQVKEGGIRCWQEFQHHYTGMTPFADEEIRECIQIAPKDLSFLGIAELPYGNNLFLQQAYAKYGHLLLGKYEDGRVVLGVPGMFRDMQDEHLARMFGFPQFKEGISGEEHFGYWYHFVGK